MKRVLASTLFAVLVSTKSLACGMSVFGNPLFIAFMPALLVIDAVDSGMKRADAHMKKAAQGVHDLKAEARKKPEYLHLERELDKYLDCAEKDHSCCTIGTHDKVENPVFLRLHREQDQQAWASLVTELLSKKMERFAALSPAQLAALPAQFKVNLEKINMAKLIVATPADTSPEDFLASYEYHFIEPQDAQEELRALARTVLLHEAAPQA